MPNHMHGIIVLMDHGRDVQLNVPTECRYKGNHEFCLQARYYEHIIHSDKDLINIRDYIDNNPLKWATDDENPFQ
jgi:putative transposase